jgi:hypothetical protein
LLLEALRQPEPAPASLGLRWDGEVETSAGVATRVLVWADVDDPTAVVAALAGLRDYGDQGEDILLRFAFDGGATIPACGLALVDLTPLQKLGLEALRAPGFARSFHFLRRFGLGIPADVNRFLEAREPFFRPLRALPRQFHLGRAWAEYCGDAIAADEIVAAIRQQLSVDEAVSAFCVQRRSHLVRLGVAFSPAIATRQATLPLAYANAVDQGELRAALLRASATPAVLDEPMFAALALVAFADTLPTELEAIVQQGVRFKNFDEPLAGLLERLPAPLRARVSWPTVGPSAS